VLYEAHRNHYAQDNDHVLVWQADTRTMNSTIDEGLIQRELERDPDAAKAEWLAGFRDDLEAAFSLQALEACVIKGRDELPASPIISYCGFVDPSGGRHDAFTLAIGHNEAQKAVLDLVKAWHPPFDPSAVVGEISELAKGYGVSSLTGDNYGGEWPVEAFRHHGIRYERAEKHKSEIYLAMIPLVNSQRVELLDDQVLLDQLRRLERRRGRTGKDTIDHPPRLNDDVANAVAGVSYLAINGTAGQSQSGFNPAKHIAAELIPARQLPFFIGVTLTTPTASVVAQSLDDSIEILQAFASDGGLGHHLKTHLRPWLVKNGGQKVIGCYNEEGLDLAVLQSLVLVIEETLGGTWDQASAPWEARREAMLTVFTDVKHFTLEPRLKVSPAATLVAPALSRPWDLRDKSVYGAVANALSLVIDRIESRNQRPLKQTTVILHRPGGSFSGWGGR
jgi:hypothetical protein